MPLAEQTRVERPIYYLAKVCFVYFLVVIDIALNSSINSDNYTDIAYNEFWPYLFLVLQTCAQVFIFLTLFLMMCGTYLMRIGLPGVVFADFKWLAILQGLYLLFTIVVGIMRIAAWGTAGNADPMKLWEFDGFEFAFLVQMILGAFYYHQVFYTSFRLAEEKYYVKSAWGDLSKYAPV